VRDFGNGERTAYVQVRLRKWGYVADGPTGLWRPGDYAGMLALADRRREVMASDLVAGNEMAGALEAAEIDGRDRLCLFVALLLPGRDLAATVEAWARVNAAWDAAEDSFVTATYRVHGHQPGLVPAVGERHRRLAKLWPEKKAHHDLRSVKPREPLDYAVWSAV
jgi:hypothetical protein